MTRLVSILFIFLTGYGSFASENVKYSTEFKLGTVLIDSAGLNKITNGLNTSYGTDFSNIRTPIYFSGLLGLEFYRSRVGVELGYEYSSRSSVSDLFGITEDIRYKAVPISLNYQYRLLDSERFKLFLGAYLGIMDVRLSMSTSPIVVESNPYEMAGTAFLCGAGIDLVTKLSNNFGLLTSLSYRYAATSDLNYSGDSLRHNNGDTVVLSDGSALTLNLSGIEFSVGIIFEWSQI